MTMSEPEFNLGQMVYVAWASAYARKMITCPICDGYKSVTLILGSGEHVPVECQGCGLGYDGPQGTISTYEPDSGVREDKITGIAVSGNGYMYSTLNHSPDLCDIFSTMEEAEPRRLVLLGEAQEQVRRNFEAQFKQKKKDHGWTVHYHRREIIRLEKTLEWHRTKLTGHAPN